MSWFSSPSIDDKVDQATSESLPSGQQDLALNLEICDLIRSKTVPPKDAMRSLKRRLLNKNPNVQILSLHLIDICIKNGGNHFLAEISSREFMDSVVLVLKPNAGSVNPQVKALTLEYLQNWAHAFEGQIQHAYINKVYQQLKAEGFEFPLGAVINSSFIDSSAPPEWIDSDTCMKCSEPFSFVNRKHHCRNCGRVFDNKHCSNYAPLPHYGIYDPVRVCDDCNDELRKKSGSKKVQPQTPAVEPSNQSFSNNQSLRPGPLSDDEDEDLKRALALSLEESNKAMKPPMPLQPASTTTASTKPDDADDDDDDEDMKAAIAASLREIGQSSTEKTGSEGVTGGGVTSGLYELPSANTQSYHSDSYNSYDPSSQPHILSPSSQPSSQPESADLSPLEIEIMYRYIQMVENMQNAPPGAILHDIKVQQLNENVSMLRPKLARSLRETVEKCDKMEDLHGKLTAVARYWDRLLEDRLSHTYRWSQPQGPYQYQSQTPDQQYYAPQLSPQASGQSYMQNPPQSIQPQTTGQYQYSYGAPSVPTTGPGQSLSYGTSAPPYSEPVQSTPTGNLFYQPVDREAQSASAAAPAQPGPKEDAVLIEL